MIFTSSMSFLCPILLDCNSLYLRRSTDLSECLLLNHNIKDEKSYKEVSIIMNWT